MFKYPYYFKTEEKRSYFIKFKSEFEYLVEKTPVTNS